MVLPCGAHVIRTAAPVSATILFRHLNWRATVEITIKVKSLHLQLSWLIEFQRYDKYSKPLELSARMHRDTK